MLTPGEARADCVIGGVVVQCANTSTTDTTYPMSPPDDRNYTGPSVTPLILVVEAGATITGHGLAMSNTGAGGVLISNGGAITVNAGNTPTAGGTAALSVAAAGGTITYTGGDITNNGAGNAFDAVQTGGGSIDIDITGDLFAAMGEGLTVRDIGASTGVSVVTGAVTALTAGKDGIDVQSQSLTGDLAIVANGDIRAGNAGIVAVIFPGAGTGNIDVTANGSVDARFGIDAENFGTGSTTVTAVGPITATTGNGVFALAAGGDVTVTAGDVTSTGNRAIVAQQTDAAGGGAVSVTAGDVSGTTGVVAINAAGAVVVTASGAVTGTVDEGIVANGAGAVTVTAADAVTGATRGLSLAGGIGGAGDISVTGAGGFIGGTDDAANIRNDGAGTVTVEISGASSSAAGEGVVVRDTGVGGDISVTTGAVTALTAGKDGIDVQSQSLTGDIAIVANGDIRAGNAGVVAAIFPAAGAGNIDVTANGSVDGRFGIDAENSGTGSTTVTAVGPITATAGNGVFARAAGGDVTVTAGDVTSTGNRAIVAQQTDAAGGGAVSVTAGDVSGTTGVVAINAAGAVVVTASGAVTGTVDEGVVANGAGAVTVTAADAVTGATRGLSLAGGIGGAGDISVTGAGGFVGGTGDAASIRNDGAGTVTVEISGASHSTGGHGVVVLDTGLGGDISVTTGAVTALAGGMSAINIQTDSVTADVTAVANGDLQGGDAGVLAFINGAAATGNLSVTTNGSVDGLIGIVAANFGAGTIAVTAAGPVTATDGGIFAQANGGAIVVDAGDVAATVGAGITAQLLALTASTVDVTAGHVSGTTGIAATTGGAGAITVTAGGTVTGLANEGIRANGGGAVTVDVADTVTGATRGLLLTGGTSGAGDILVTGTGGFVGGTGDAANILNNGSGAITVDISGASRSTNREGFVVGDTAAGGDISVTTGAVTALAANMNALDVWTRSATADVTVIANGDLQAGGAGVSASITAFPATGNLSVTTNGSVAGRNGITAINAGTGSTTVTAVGPITAAGGSGIYANTAGGDLTVTAVDVTSDMAGIVARQTGAAGAGAIEVTARDVRGAVGVIASNSGTGATRVTSLGTVAGLNGEGIQAFAGINAGGILIDALNVSGTTSGISTGNTGVGSTAITVRGAVEGGDIAISALSSAAQGVSIVNEGVIRNASGLSSDVAIAASGGVVDLANAGSLLGGVHVSADSSVFRNLGSWNSIGGVSNFTGVDDFLANGVDGEIVGRSGAGAVDNTIWAGLESFETGGRITLADGGIDDAILTTANSTFLGGSVLAVDIGGVNGADVFYSSGTVDIAPGSALAVSVGQPVALYGRHVVVQADGGLTGEFAFEDTFVTAFAGLRDGYTATTAYVELAQLRALADAGITPNQTETAAGADSLADGNPLKDALLLLPDDAAAIEAFDQLSGEIHASARMAMAEDAGMPRNAVLDRLGDGGRESAVWVRAFHGRGESDGDLNAAGMDRKTSGAVFGADRPLGENIVVGVAAGWLDTDLEIAGRNSAGSVTSAHGLAYMGARFGGWNLRAGVGYAMTSTEIGREIAFPGFSDSLRADYDGSVLQGFLEAGYRMPLGGGYVEPFAGLTAIRAETDAFTEVGGAAALSGEAISDDVAVSTLGLRFETSQRGAFSLRGSTGWRHGWGDLDPAGRHAFDGGAAFAVRGAARSNDAAFASVEARWRVSRNVTLGLAYDGVLGTDGADHGVTGSLRIVF